MVCNAIASGRVRERGLVKLLIKLFEICDDKHIRIVPQYINTRIQPADKPSRETAGRDFTTVPWRKFFVAIPEDHKMKPE